MKKLLEIFTNHKHAIIWTICYIFIMWAVLYFLFNFSIFNGAQWHKLAHAQLHGIAGFAFGLLILSALPLYIATTTLIIRNKKPLITIPKPNIKLPLLTKETSTTPVANDTEPTPTKPTEQEPELPDDLPPELHSIFIRARNRIDTYEQCAPTTTPNAASPDTGTPNDTLPLPMDFDIQLDNIPGMNDTPVFNTPVFTDINFDDTTEESDNTSTQALPDNQKIIEHLTATNTTFTQIDDMIITDKHAIITHSDSDFWVIDNENWFANGKTRPSPIKKIQEYATQHNLSPVIYLESTNIMDLDIHISTWQSEGIIIISTPDEL